MYYTKEGEKFRILSLDGGGIRGVLSARLLQEVEIIVQETTGQKLHEYFHLVAGTSTGSILAAGIACQKNARDMIDLYKEQGNNIFLQGVRDQRKWRWLGRAIGANALYPHKDKNWGFANVFKKILLKPGNDYYGLANVLTRALRNPVTKKPAIIADEEIEKQIQLLILAYDVKSRNTTWFSNDDLEGWCCKKNIPLWQICTASASAPTFFPPYQISYWDEEQKEQKKLTHIDGGVAANNPALAAVSHALSMTTTGDRKKPCKLEDIAVLSIGTGKTTSSYTYDDVKKWGLFDWVRKIPDIFMDPNAENTENICRRMFLGVSHKNYLRLGFDLNIQDQDKKDEIRQLYKKCLEKNIGKSNISEEIDDPEICEELIEAAQCYLDVGQVKYGYEGPNFSMSANQDQARIQVKQAIRQFIDLHKDKTKDEKKESEKE